jgi:hypothetical protein
MPEISPSRFMVQAGWDDVPHLDEKTKDELLDSTPPHLRDARSKGIPSLGAGAIYPIPLEEVVYTPFPLPAYWPRAFAMDVGWNRTAALWGAWDRTDSVLYVYAEHYRGQEIPAVHATAIKARGEWIPGCIDPASRGRSQVDGESLFQIYRTLGLNLKPADNTVDAGLNEVLTGLITGRIKFSRALANLQAEYGLYRRNEHGKIVKQFDHLMDCLRYLVMTGKGIAKVQAPDTAHQVAQHVGDALIGY